jgi:hypothetical protein
MCLTAVPLGLPDSQLISVVRDVQLSIKVGVEQLVQRRVTQDLSVSAAVLPLSSFETYSGS